MSTLCRRLAIALILIPCLSLATLLIPSWRLQVAGYLLHSVLSRLGGTDIRFSLDTLNDNELVIDHLACTLPSPGGSIALRLTDLTLNYTFASIWQRQIQELTLDSLVISLSRSSGQPRQALPDPAELLHTWYPHHVPLQRLLIRRLRFQGPGSTFLAGKTVGLTFTNLRPGMRLGLHAWMGTTWLQATIMAMDADHWHGQVYTEASRKKPLLDFSLQARNRGLELQGRIQLEQLAGLLGSEGLTGSTRFWGRLRPPQGHSMGFTLDTQTTGSRPPLMTVKSLQTSLEGTMRTSPLGLQINRVRLVGRGIRRSKMTIDAVQAQGKGRIDLGVGGLAWQWVLVRPLVLDGVTQENLVIKQITLAPQLKMEANQEALQLALPAGWQLAAKGITRAGVSCPHLLLTTIQVTQGRLTFKPTSWSITPGNWRIGSPRLSMNTGSAWTGPLQIDIKQAQGGNANRHVLVQLATPQLHVQLAGQTLVANAFHGSFSLENTQFQARLHFRPDKVAGAMILQVTGQDQSGQALLQTSSPLAFRSQQPLHALVHPWPFPFDLDQGSLTVTGQLDWHQQQINQASLAIHLEKAAGRIGKIRFLDASLHQDLEVWPKVLSRRPGQLHITTLYLGPIQVRDISCKNRLLPGPATFPGQVLIQGLTAQIFGGHVSSPGVALNIQPLKSTFTLALDNIDMAAILALLKREDLQVQGRLSGTLPFRLNGKKIWIRQGKLHSLPPGGIIRYHLDTAKTPASPSTRILFKALEEYTFDHMRAQVDYQPDGRLQIDFHLQGKSPGLDRHRPVHLNIRTEQNLLSLLKSLDYSQSLVRELDKKVKHHYRPGN